MLAFLYTQNRVGGKIPSTLKIIEPKVIAHYMPLRVSDRDEAIGLDDCEHKETAYPTFMGLDS